MPVTQTDINASELDQLLRDQVAASQSGAGTITPLQHEIAAGNWASLNSQTSIHSQTGTANGKVCIAAIILTAKVSGFFRVDMNYTFSGNTTAKKCKVGLVTLPLASAAITTTGTKGASGVFGKYADASADAEILQSDAAGTAASGLLVGGAALNDAAAGTILQFIDEQKSLTGLLTTDAADSLGSFFSGIVWNGLGTVKVPFALQTSAAPNQRVAFGITFQDETTGAELWTPSQCNLFVQELPLG